MCSRKIASVSGDIRRALNVCMNAIETWYERGDKKGKIGIGDINQSYKELGQNIQVEV